MIYLILGIIFSYSMSMVMRSAAKYTVNPMAMYMSNYFVCILFALFFTGKPDFTIEGMSVPFMYGAVSGALYLVSLAAYDRSLKINGLGMSAVFNKLGIIFPALMAVAVFKEKTEAVQIAGFVLAVTAIVIMYCDKNSMQQIGSRRMLVYLLFAAGICDSMANIYTKTGIPELKNYFLLFNFIFAFLFSTVSLFLRKKKFSICDLGIGALIGIPNYLSSRCVLYALSEMSAVVVYPVYNVSVLFLLIVTGVLFFKETMTLKKGISLCMVCAALVMLNI